MSAFFIDAQGWLHAPHCQHIPSPHHNARPDENDISLCVLHNISLPPQQFGERYINALFLGKIAQYRDVHPFFTEILSLCVSAHFFINRDGSIRQYVSTLNRAWHAGISQYEGRDNCNDFSIGIEINGADHIPYTLAQYQRCAQLIRALHARHPAITFERITHHSHIAPSRKTDPGAAWRQAYLSYLLKR